MRNVAFRVEEIQSLKQIFENDGEEQRRQPARGISMQQREHAVPKRRVYEAPMLAVRALDVERVEKRADGNSAGMTAHSRVGYAIVNVELVIELLPQG
jgi:hypothetical protein